MIAKMSIDIAGGGSSLTDAQWDCIKKLWPGTTGEKPAYWWPSEITADVDYVLLATQDLGFKVEIKAFSSHGMLVKLKDGFDHEMSSVENYKAGTLVQVHIPDIALMTYNEITVEYDSCTDQIQTMLNDGWRMIAVCPPNAQRRPDYIMGRYVRKEKN